MHISRKLWFVMTVLAFAGLVVGPATAAGPTTYPVVNDVMMADCHGDVYEGIGNGSYTVHDTSEGSRFTNQTTVHIVWRFVNTEDESDTFTYIDTGVAQIRADGTATVVSVSGHTTARPGDGALAYGRWIRVDDPEPVYWINRGHRTDCTIIPLQVGLDES